MGSLDNPAGRLHALLSEYQSVADRSKSIHQTWAEILGVKEPALLPHLAGVAELIPQIDQAITKGGHAEQRTLFDEFSRAWSLPILGGDHGMRQTPSPGPRLIDPGALAALGGLSAYLSAVSPEGSVPDEETAGTLRSQVEDLLSDLAEDPVLPRALAEAMNHRLHDILWAMDHVRIGGPGAVEAATERLLGQIVIHTNQDVRENSGFLKKALKALGIVWVAYKAGPEAHAALEGWEHVLGELPPGS